MKESNEKTELIEKIAALQIKQSEELNSLKMQLLSLVVTTSGNPLTAF